jgi:ABC-type sugar transport system ATPase subunit
MYVASNIKKHYGGVQALDGVDLEIRPGEVHALLGANGAGKSTMVKVLVGAEEPTEGTLRLNGEEVGFQNVGEAADRGIAIVSQELNLFGDFDVLHNLFLLREPLSGGLLVDRAEMRRRAAPVVEAVGLDVSLSRKVGTLRLGEQQLVEIARALLNDPKILFLDEPTSALQAAETQRLLGVVRRLRDRGVGIVYVSHYLEDVFAIADTITILRNGKAVVERRPREAMSIPEAVREMLGGTAASRDQRIGVARNGGGGPANAAPLRLEGVSVRHMLQPTTLDANPGEVVGLAGLDGSGARTVLDVIFGRCKADGGAVTLPSGAAGPTGMNGAVRAGVAYVPADRKQLGLMLHKPIFENVATVSSGPLRRMGLILRTRRLVARAEHWRETLSIVSPTARTRVSELSGGNQQKVVFAKWLEAEPKVVLLDDPSRGVDIGAKAEMHTIITEMRARQQIILYTSSDLEEMAELCDRVIVFFQGGACGELAGDELSEHRLLESINTGVVDTREAA